MSPQTTDGYPGGDSPANNSNSNTGPPPDQSENDMAVHSLGAALAGVTMGSSGNTNSNSSSHNNIAAAADSRTYSSPSPTSPFALGGGGSSSANKDGGAAASDSNDGWGNFADPTAASAAQTSGTGTPTGGGIHSGSREQDLELFLTQGASQALGDADVFRYSQQNLASLTNDDTPNSHHSNSHTDNNNTNSAFRLQSSSSLAPGMGGGPVMVSTASSSTTPSFGDLRGGGAGPGAGAAAGHSDPSRRRTESPSCSVTGTTTSSRSVSPYTNNSENVVVTTAGSGGGSGGGRVIHAYQRNDSPSSGYLSHGHGSHPSLGTLDSTTNNNNNNNVVVAQRSPYAKDRIAPFKQGGPAAPGGGGGSGAPPLGPSSPFESDPVHRSSSYVSLHSNDNLMSSPQQQVQQQQAPAPAVAAGASGANAQSQVLYMAVPSPDGHGQVLQPVQMVQIPGKPTHFVAAGSVPSNDQVLPPLSNQQQQQQQQQLVGGTNGNNNPGMGMPPSPMQQMQQQQTPLGGGENRSRVAQYAIDTSSHRTASPSAYSNDLASPVPATPLGDDYQVDSAVSTLYSSPQRPPLEALLGEVRRLSRDQVGCRLVQQALDEEGPMAATLILNEGLPFWAEAMIDPFGNYLFQKILEKVTPQERIMLVKSVSPRLVNASLNLHGTRSVQKVVEMCSQDEQVGYGEGVEETAADILTASLAPAAARLCIDSHGNHVIQRILLKLGPKHVRFVFDAVAASVEDVARHRHGCCVIQRCLDSPPNEARAHLVRRIVEKSLELMQDAYGNYVVQYVLDVCSDEDVHAVCDSVTGRVNLLAIQKFSSNVMEKCLERCDDRVKELYLQEMSDPDRIRELMMDPFGNYVVQRALSVATHVQAIRLVEAMRPHLIATQTQGPHGQRNGGVRNTAGGRRIIAKICRRFPNFTLTAVGSQEEIYTSNKGGHHHQHNHHAPRQQQQQQQHHPHHHGPPQQQMQQHHHQMQQQQHHQQQMHPHHTAPHGSVGAIGGYATMNSAVGGHPLSSASTLNGQQLGYGDPRLNPAGMNLPAQQQPPPQQSYYSLGGVTPYYTEPQYPTNPGGLGGFDFGGM